MLSLDQRTLIPVGIGLIVSVITNYIYSVWKYRHDRTKSRQNIPPTYPAVIPFIGHAVLFMWNTPRFLKNATSYAGKLTSTSIDFFPGWKILFFQDPETVKRIWKKSEMLSAVRMRVYAYKYLFGMPAKWASIYESDDSGPYPKPLPGTNVPPEKRIHHFLAQGIEKALTGPGLTPTTRRLHQSYAVQIRDLNISDEWTEGEDWPKFIHHTTGKAIILAIFGPKLLELNPSFMGELFEFDRVLPWLAKGVPRFVMPRAYEVRKGLQDSFKTWYMYARTHFEECHVDADGDGDPFWGSNWMRHRQTTLAHIQDDDTLASSDLGVAWASAENMTRNTTMAMIHILQDKNLVHRIRQELHAAFRDQRIEDIDPKLLANVPLLSSIYAETLRLHVKTYTILYSPHANVPLGRYMLPKRSVGLVNSYFSHMDEEWWNTRDGKYPLHSFWADRFIVDPADPASGPMNPSKREAVANNGSPVKAASENQGSPYYSIDGLEGSWIPYGGGRLMCPGRFLAKNSIILSCATLATEFDIELLTDSIEWESKSFGIGTDAPKKPVPYRMRRRQRT